MNASNSSKTALSSVALLFIACPALPASPEGKVMTACKNEIYRVLGEDTRTKMKRYRRTGITFQVSAEAASQQVKCVYNKEGVQLFIKDELINEKPENEPSMNEPISDSETIVSELSALNSRFIHNYITNNVPSHDAITHPKFTLINSSGGYQDKEQYLEDWATGFHPDKVVYFDLRDERIDVFGDTALVRAINKHTFVQDGNETTGMTAYTDTYVRENGEWLCIQAQLTTVSPENYPPDSTIIKRYIRGVKHVP